MVEPEGSALVTEVDPDPPGPEAPGPHPSIEAVPKNRIHVREHGCWNCTHWECGSLAEKHYQVRRQADAGTLLARRLDAGQPFAYAMREVARVLRRMDEAVKPPISGLCLAGGTRADFVLPGFICDRWTGRIGVDGPIEKLPGELYDRLGEKPPEG